MKVSKTKKTQLVGKVIERLRMIRLESASNWNTYTLCYAQQRHYLHAQSCIVAHFFFIHYYEVGTSSISVYLWSLFLFSNSALPASWFASQITSTPPGLARLSRLSNQLEAS